MINFTDFVNIHSAGGLDIYGIPVMGEVIKDVPCKIMYSLVQDDLEIVDGKSIKVKARVYFDGFYPLQFTDKLEFTDVFGYEHMLDILDMKPIIDFSDVLLYTRATV